MSIETMDTNVQGREKPSVQDVRRRRARRAWIPSVVGVVVLLTATVATLAIQAQGIGSPRTVPPAVGPNGYSQFDAAGMRYISDTRTVWFDLRIQPMRVDALKLPADQTTSIGSRGEIGNFLGLYGNAIPVKVRVDSIDITTTGGAVTIIDATVTAHGSYSDVRDDLAVAMSYGLNADEVSTFLSQSLRLNRSGQAYSKTLGPGEALGVPISVSVACSSSDDCEVHYLIRPSA